MFKRIVDLLYFKLDYLLLLFFISLSVVVMLSQDNPQIRKFQADISDLFSFLSVPVLWIDQVEGLISENRRLQEELLRMKLLNLSLVEAQKENERLLRLLNFKEQSFYRLLPARVTNRGTATLFNSITIDVGSADGALVNLPVISTDGVIGKTISVGKYNSICQLMTDVNFRISVKVQNARAYGILRCVSGTKAVIEGIPKTIPIQKGERVITSGYSDIYPIGLEVGVVEDIRQDEEGIFQKVFVQCSANFDEVEEVFLVLANE